MPQLEINAENINVFERIKRYGSAKKNNLEIVEYIEELMLKDEVLYGHVPAMVDKLYNRLDKCASWLTFRHYIDHKANRLTSANFCGKHLLCQPCAIRRGSQKLRAYHQKIVHVLKENPKLKASMLTFTVKDGDNLRERFNHLQSSIKKLLKNRNYNLNADKKFTEMSKIQGAVLSYEVKKGKNSGLWHPHCHILILHEEELCMGRVNPLTGKGNGLCKEWFKITGDSFIVDCRRKEYQDVIDLCMEVFKYAVKFTEQEPSDTWHCFQVLNHRRLFSSFGNLRGVKLPSSMIDEKLDGPYIEYMFRYLSGGHYTQISKVDMSEHYDDASSSL
ncbi:MAG: protein rep [Methylococcales bacterium]|nr:protein rep [Methylococcales bacterium]